MKLKRKAKCLDKQQVLNVQFEIRITSQGDTLLSRETWACYKMYCDSVVMCKLWNAVHHKFWRRTGKITYIRLRSSENGQGNCWIFELISELLQKRWVKNDNIAMSYCVTKNITSSKLWYFHVRQLTQSSDEPIKLNIFVGMWLKGPRSSKRRNFVDNIS